MRVVQRDPNVAITQTRPHSSSTKTASNGNDTGVRGSIVAASASNQPACRATIAG